MESSACTFANQTEMMRYLTLFVLAFATLHLHAQQITKDTISFNDLKEVTIIGVKDMDARKNAHQAKLVYTSKDFERFELTTIGDYLRSLPGIVMDKGNESKDVKFRGLDKEYTQILIDGERIPDGGEKREFQVDRIPLNMVERIEIIRAPTANMDAHGAAGTINIILKKAYDRNTLRLNASLGKVEEQGMVYDSYLQFGNKLGKKANFLVNGGYQTRVAPKVKYKDSYKNGSLQTTDIEDEVKKYKEANLAPRLNWTPSQKHQFQFDPLFLFSEEDKSLTKPALKFNYNNAGVLTKTDTTTENSQEIKERTGWAVRGTYTYIISPKHQLNVRPIVQSYNEIKNRTFFKYKADGSSVIEASTEQETKQDKELLTRVTYQYTGELHQFNAGAEVSTKDRNRDKTRSKNGVPEKAGAKDRYDAKENRLNAWLMDDINLAKKHLLSPGIRMELTQVNTTSRYFNTANKDTVVIRSYNYATFNPSVNYLYRISGDVNIRANLAKTVRRPQFDQLSPFYERKNGTLANPDNIGNPNLQPETSVGGDLGMEYFAGKQNKTGVFGVNLFYRDITNVIETIVYQDPLFNRYVSQQVNGGNGKVWGVEIDARYTWHINRIGQIIPKCNYSLLRSKILDAKTQQERKFKGQPDYVFNAGFEYIHLQNKLSFGANYNKVPINCEAETKQDGSYETKENTDIQRLDLFLSYNLTQKFAIRVSGQNLLTTTKEVRKHVYNAAGVLQNFDIEREHYASTFMLSAQWNIR